MEVQDVNLRSGFSRCKRCANDLHCKQALAAHRHDQAAAEHWAQGLILCLERLGTERLVVAESQIPRARVACVLVVERATLQMPDLWSPPRYGVGGGSWWR
jgi:hypothetical protein